MKPHVLPLGTKFYKIASTVCPVHSFSTVLQREMSSEAWAKLEQPIRNRFSPYLSDTQALEFSGIMQWVYCSVLGSFIARAIRPFSILPEIIARNAAFDFNITLNKGEIRKQRQYKLSPSSTFTFTSLFSHSPQLHEEFGGGIGMYLKLSEEQGALIFRDNGYFFRIKRWRLPLPRWLTVGCFELLHRNIDQQRFQVIIRVAHPLFGTLFYQRGEFESVSKNAYSAIEHNP